MDTNKPIIVNELSDYCELKGITDPNMLKRTITSSLEKDSTGICTRSGKSAATKKKIIEKHLAQKQKLACLGLLISSIAHETCNLNNCITFNTPILRDYVEKLVSLIEEHLEKNEDIEIFGMPYLEFRKDVFKVLDSIEHASNRITETSYGLKDFVRMTSHQNHAWVEVGEVIAKAVAICRGELRKTVRSFEVNIAKDLPPIFVESAALEQVLVNLLVNAAQAADKEDSWVILTARNGNSLRNHLIIEVSDNGCGMDEEIMMKIFEPFFTTKEELRGSGLGLFVSKNLIKGLRGQIGVESIAGRGSTFRIDLSS
jgi:C4-dicarboxylate-specific signal transduction histidine kinase